MNTITLEVIKIKQPIGDIYIAKINPQDLLSMSIVDRRRIEEDDEILGIQRELKKDKVLHIKSYLSSIDATFPNSIIVNTSSKHIINKKDDKLELAINDDSFIIIDGQHRLEGFRDNIVSNFELIVTIFIDLEIDQQADIFSTINSQQTKVDPSLNLNLELNSNVYTPKKMMIEIAQSFNYDDSSPWYKGIKMLTSKTKGIISLSAFVKPLLELTYPEKDYYKIRNELMKQENIFPTFNTFQYDVKKYLFWEFYKKKDYESIYKILYNYFNALKVLLNQDWLNEDSLLNKTTGYNAMIKLFKEISVYGLSKGDLSYEFFFNTLEPIQKLNGLINKDNYGTSGFEASKNLYDDMMKLVSIKYI